MKTILARLYLALLLFFLNISISFAQCAMCRATVENSVSDGGDLVAGLNAGIMYLAIIPYIMIGGIAFFWYKSSKKKNLFYKANWNV